MIIFFSNHVVLWLLADWLTKIFFLYCPSSRSRFLDPVIFEDGIYQQPLSRYSRGFYPVKMVSHNRNSDYNERQNLSQPDYKDWAYYLVLLFHMKVPLSIDLAFGPFLFTLVLDPTLSASLPITWGLLKFFFKYNLSLMLCICIIRVSNFEFPPSSGLLHHLSFSDELLH